jgi:hypothetical protein
MGLNGMRLSEHRVTTFVQDFATLRPVSINLCPNITIPTFRPVSINLCPNITVWFCTSISYSVLLD